MIEIDSRRGSGELERYFVRYGIKTSSHILPFGDFAWLCKRENGWGYAGVERKRIDDLIQCMKDNRFAGFQLRGMADTFDIGYLIVEGLWKVGADDELLIFRGGNRKSGSGAWESSGMHSGSVINFVMGFGFTAGLMPWRSSGPEETVAFIVRQYQWWQKEWEEHKAHDSVYAPSRPNGEGRQGFFLNLNPRHVTFREKMALQLPGIDDKSRFVDQWFGSAKEMANAGPETWANKVWMTRGKNGKRGQFRKLGLIAAEKIVSALRGKE